MRIDDDWHIFVLHCLFMPRIEEELDQFKRIWNNHQVSTEKNKTPLQMLALRIDYCPPAEVVDENGYGVDEYNGDDVSDDGEDYSVPCNPIQCPMTPHNLDIFKSRVEPLNLTTPASDLENWFYTTVAYALQIKEEQLQH